MAHDESSTSRTPRERELEQLLAEARREADDARRTAADYQAVFDRMSNGLGVLEQLVSVRTSELQRTNAALEAEIAERLRAERELRESEERYRAVLRDQTELIGRFHADGTILFVNEAWVRFFGLPEKDVIGQLAWPVVVAEDRLRVLALIESLTPEHPVDSIENRIRRPDGTVRWTHWTNRGIFDADGRRVGWQAVGRDITDRKAAEEALRDSEARFRMAVKTGGVTVYTQDTDCRYTWMFNPNTFNAGDFIGKTELELDFLEPADWLPVHELKRRVLETGRPAREVLPRRYPDGQRYFDTAVEPMRGPAGEIVGLIGASIDVTAMMNAQNEIRRLSEELEQRVRERTTELEQAIAELEAFSYSVSHDLRSPLRAIAGCCATVRQTCDVKLDLEERRQIENIEANAGRMIRLIEGLLDFSRLGRSEVRRTSVDMGRLVERALHEIRQTALAQEIEVAIDPLPPVSGDAGMLHQVWVNLLSNAVKFSRPKGTARIEVGGALQDGEVVYHVRDHGVGFDPDYAAKLFQVFQRLHSNDDFEGTGVGLALVKRIVERHGGRVWANSVVGEGACFYFSLPPT